MAPRHRAAQLITQAGALEPQLAEVERCLNEWQQATQPPPSKRRRLKASLTGDGPLTLLRSCEALCRALESANEEVKLDRLDGRLQSLLGTLWERRHDLEDARVEVLWMRLCFALAKLGHVRLAWTFIMQLLKLLAGDQGGANEAALEWACVQVAVQLSSEADLWAGVLEPREMQLLSGLLLDVTRSCCAQGSGHPTEKSFLVALLHCAARDGPEEAVASCWRAVWEGLGRSDDLGAALVPRAVAMLWRQTCLPTATRAQLLQELWAAVPWCRLSELSEERRQAAAADWARAAETVAEASADPAEVLLPTIEKLRPVAPLEALVRLQLAAVRQLLSGAEEQSLVVATAASDLQELLARKPDPGQLLEVQKEALRLLHAVAAKAEQASPAAARLLLQCGRLRAPPRRAAPLVADCASPLRFPGRRRSFAQASPEAEAFFLAATDSLRSSPELLSVVEVFEASGPWSPDARARLLQRLRCCAQRLPLQAALAAAVPLLSPQLQPLTEEVAKGFGVLIELLAAAPQDQHEVLLAEVSWADELLKAVASFDLASDSAAVRSISSTSLQVKVLSLKLQLKGLQQQQLLGAGLELLQPALAQLRGAYSRREPLPKLLPPPFSVLGHWDDPAAARLLLRALEMRRLSESEKDSSTVVALVIYQLHLQLLLLNWRKEPVTLEQVSLAGSFVRLLLTVLRCWVAELPDSFAWSGLAAEAAFRALEDSAAALERQGAAHAELGRLFMLQAELCLCINRGAVPVELPSTASTVSRALAAWRQLSPTTLHKEAQLLLAKELERAAELLELLREPKLQAEALQLLLELRGTGPESHETRLCATFALSAALGHADEIARIDGTQSLAPAAAEAWSHAESQGEHGSSLLVEARRLEAMATLAQHTDMVFEEEPLVNWAQKVSGSRVSELGLTEMLLALADWLGDWTQPGQGEAPLLSMCTANRVTSLLRRYDAATGPRSSHCWSKARYAQLRLRGLWRLAKLNERFGLPMWADFYFEAGHLFLLKVAAGAVGWKLRLLSGRAQLALTGYCCRAAAKVLPVSELLERVDSAWAELGRGPLKLAEAPELPAQSITGELLELWATMLKAEGRKAPTGLLAAARRLGSLTSHPGLTSLLLTDGAVLHQVQGLMQRVDVQQGKQLLAWSVGLVLHHTGQWLLGHVDLANLSLGADEAALVLRRCAASSFGGLLPLQPGSEAETLEASLQVFLGGLRCGLWAGHALAVRRCAQVAVDLVQRLRLKVEDSIAADALLASLVPLCSGVNALLLHELRSCQRSLEALSDAAFLARLAQPSPCVPCGAARFANSAWLAELPLSLSAAWLQMNSRADAVQISRLVDNGPRKQLLSVLRPVGKGAASRWEGELASLHKENQQRLAALLQQPDANSVEARRTFWQDRKAFDEKLRRFAEGLQQELLGSWAFLLAPWPEPELGHLEALETWLRTEPVASQLPPAPRPGQPASSSSWLLLLLFANASTLTRRDVAEVLAALTSRIQPGTNLALVAGRLQQHRSGCKDSRSQRPLLLFVDSIVSQLPLEACPCLMEREVARAVAPNLALSALTRRASAGAPRSGFFVLDPFGDIGAASESLAELFKRLCSHRGPCWHGRVGKPAPEVTEVLKMLGAGELFVYQGHGESSKKLLPHEKLQLGAGSKGETQPLRSVMLMMGCSSAKTFSFKQEHGEAPEHESFGLPLSALVGGSPAIVGALWDVLGGDLGKLAASLLDSWIGVQPSTEQARSLLSAVVAARRNCLLPYLTGAAVVCYGVPL